MTPKSLFINGWPGSVRPLDDFIPHYKNQLIIVCTENLATAFKSQGWECLIVSSHSIESYEIELLPVLCNMEIFSVIADSELHILPAAYLREKLNIQGQDLRSANAFRNKLEMVNFLTNAKTFKVPLTFTTESREKGNLENKIAPEKKYIIKPISGTDSFEVTTITGSDLLQKIEISPAGFFIQEFIDLPVYHVDGVVCDGKLVFYSVSKYDSTCLAYAKSESQFLGSTIVFDKNIIDSFGHVIHETLSLMPTPKNTTFHSEFFLDDASKDIYFCEIASRSPGGSGALVNMIEYVYGVNLSYEMIAHNMPSYIPKDDRYRIERQERQTASAMFIPLNLVNHLPEAIPDNVIYYHGTNSREPVSTDHFRTSNDAIKIVFTSKRSDLLDEKRKICNLFGCGDS